MPVFSNSSSRSAVTGLVLVVGLAVNLAAACADGETVDAGFEDQSGGSGSTATGQGGSGTTGTPSATTGSSSPTTATTSSTASSTSASVTSGGNCTDGGTEPNDNQASSVNLGEIGDSDGDGSSVSGVISPGDEDWFKYNGSDNTGSLVDPTRMFTSSDTLTLCKYAKCPDDDQNFDCPSGTSPDNTGGLDGCCGTQGFELESFLCGSSSFNDDSALIYMRVFDPAGTACTSYTINYHF